MQDSESHVREPMWCQVAYRNIVSDIGGLNGTRASDNSRELVSGMNE